MLNALYVIIIVAIGAYIIWRIVTKHGGRFDTRYDRQMSRNAKQNRNQP